MKRLFARAVALYRLGKLAGAAALFRKVAAAGGNQAVQARRYLARIDAKRAGAKPAARKRKTVKRAKKTTRAKARGAAKRKPARKASRKPATGRKKWTGRTDGAGPSHFNEFGGGAGCGGGWPVPSTVPDAPRRPG